MSMIEFSGNGHPHAGYLARSRSGKGPGVIVIQEWWGLVGHIKSVADRFAGEGFTALAPDFFHGEATTEPDEAASLFMALNIADAEKVIQGAVQALLDHEGTTGEKVGVVGFCMGGQLSMFAACINPKIGACVNFYGVHPNVHPDFEKLEAPMLGFFGAQDHITTPDVVSALDEQLNEAGKDHEFHRMPGVGHAFFNDDRPEVYNKDAADFAWTRMLEFFRENLE
jgi:carboxymethylenebutenolidase